MAVSPAIQDALPYYTPYHCALVLFAVRRWRISKIVEVYRLDDARVRCRLAKYAGISMLLAEHAEDILRERCVQKMEEVARQQTRRGRGPLPEPRTLRDTRATLRAWTHDVLARVPPVLAYTRRP